MEVHSSMADLNAFLPSEIHTPPSSQLPVSLDLGAKESPNLVPPNLGPSVPSPNSAPGKWSQTLFPEKRPPLKFKLRFIPPVSRDEKQFGVCRKAAVEGELAVLDLTLVGFFLGRRPSFSLVKSTLLRLWKIQGNVEIIQMLHGGYAFRFSDLQDRDNILDGDVIFVGGQPMFIRQWDRSLHTGGILGLRHVPLWVSLPGLPLHLWGEESLSSICSVLGNPLYTDRNTAMKARLQFARVCVEFAGDKALLETINIEDEMGLVYEQKVTYDWKPPHCLKCGVFGHKDCGLEVMEKAPLSTNSGQVPNIETDPNLEQQQPNLFRSHVETICGEFGKEKMTGDDEEEGWQLVRARKKGSTRNGAPKPGPFRPESQRVKAGHGMVSSSYWKELTPAGEQVRQSVPLPEMGANLNFKSCTATVTGPPSHSENQTMVKPISTPPIVPLEGPKYPETSHLGPATSGSSAGHTPFPNQLASLARAIRCRQPGPLGLGNISSEMMVPNGSLGGLNQIQISPCPVQTMNVDICRPLFNKKLDSAQPEIEGECLKMVEDCMGNMGKDDAGKDNNQIAEDKAYATGPLKTLMASDLEGRGTGMEAVGQYAYSQPNRKRNIEGEGECAKSGHEMAHI